jgi:hypothetical protein
MHAFLFCLLHIQCFFPRYTCELNVFCLPALKHARVLPHVRSAFFCLRWSARVFRRMRIQHSFTCVMLLACAGASWNARVQKSLGVSRVILPGRAGRVIWFF